MNEKYNSIGWGMTRMVYRKLWWNFMSTKGITDNTCLRDYHGARRLFGSIWWVPALKKQMDRICKENAGHQFKTLLTFEP